MVNGINRIPREFRKAKMFYKNNDGGTKEQGSESGGNSGSNNPGGNNTGNEHKQA